MWKFWSLYDKVLKGFTVGEAIFVILVSWQSLADFFSVLKNGIVLRRINSAAFLFAQGHLASASQCASLFKQ